MSRQHGPHPRTVFKIGLRVTLGLILAIIASQTEAAPPATNLTTRPPILKSLVETNHSDSSHISLVPPMPTENDTLKITVSGVWWNTCVPRYQDHSLEGNEIRIYATADRFGLCIALAGPTFWSFTVEVGPLPVGLYVINVYLVEPLFGPNLYDTRSLIIPKVRLYLPLIVRRS